MRQGARKGGGSRDALTSLHAEIAACRKCAEAGYTVESVPHLVVSGPAETRLMVIGQAPPSERSSHGRPFSGPAGQRLFKLWVGWSSGIMCAMCLCRTHPAQASG